MALFLLYYVWRQCFTLVNLADIGRIVAQQDDVFNG